MRISDWSSDVCSSDLTLLREIIGRDDQPVLHVVGDATAETVLDAMAAIAPAEDWRPRRLRFEHGDGLRADLLARVRDYGVIVVQNPSHLTIASPFTAEIGRAHV